MLLLLLTLVAAPAAAGQSEDVPAGEEPAETEQPALPSEPAKDEPAEDAPVEATGDEPAPAAPAGKADDEPTEAAPAPKAGGKPAQAAPPEPAPAKSQAEPAAGGAQDRSGKPARGKPRGRQPPDGRASRALEPEPRPTNEQYDIADSSDSSAAADRFMRGFIEALTFELTVQQHERDTLGAEDPERLGGKLRERWDRIAQDTSGFQEFARQAPRQVFPLPEPRKQTPLATGELLVLEQLRQAYDASRSTRPLDQWLQHNNDFMQKSSWAKRDKAVRTRDRIIQREIDYFVLAQLGTDIAYGIAEDDTVDRITEKLNELSPGTMEAGASLALLVLDNESARNEVWQQVGKWLMENDPTSTEPVTDAELGKRISELYTAVLKESELLELAAELPKVERNLEAAERDLETLPITENDARLAALDQKVSLVKQKNQLMNQLYVTQPVPKETVEELIDTYDQLIEARMSTLGVRGALFESRLAVIERLRGRLGPRARFTWELLEAQGQFAEDLQEARPPPDLMEGLNALTALPVGLTPADIKALEANYLKQLQAKTAAQGKKAPKKAPKKPKPKPKAKPKPKPKKKGGGKSKKGGR